MTSFRQIAANRRNAAKTTRPRTDRGKAPLPLQCGALWSHRRDSDPRSGACRRLEAFEAAIAAEYDAQSAVERELVLRLAGLLWRLCRAAAIETGLFETQAEDLSELTKERPVAPVPQGIVCPILGQPSPRPDHEARPLFVPGELKMADPHNTRMAGLGANPSVDLARSFLRLANLRNCALDRLSRYEATLWRQVRQTLIKLNVLDRRKPQERGGPFRIVCSKRLSAFSEES